MLSRGYTWQGIGNEGRYLKTRISVTSQLQCRVTMMQTDTYDVLAVRQLFSPREGDITIMKSDSKTIFIKMKPHELDKPNSSYLNNSLVEFLDLMNSHFVSMYHPISQTS